MPRDDRGPVVTDDHTTHLAAQRAAIEAECLHRGWHLVEVIEDAGYSAKDLKRPGVQIALETLKQGDAGALVVAKLDQLSRSMLDFTTVMATASKQGWALVALDCALDTTTPAGEAMANVLATFAQFERRLIGQRTREALAAKRASGVRLGRPVSLPATVKSASDPSTRLGARWPPSQTCSTMSRCPPPRAVAAGGRPPCAPCCARPDRPVVEPDARPQPHPTTASGILSQAMTEESTTPDLPDTGWTARAATPCAVTPMLESPTEVGAMGIGREMATAFVEGYGATWERWDLAGFVDLFSDDVIYVEHPIDETVVGSEEMARYIRKEQSEQGAASVRMGEPIVQGDRVVAEFWATMSNRQDEEEGTLMGCFIARLNPANGRCTHFRQYWFEVEGRVSPFNGWGK